MLGQTARVCPPLLIALQKRPKLWPELCDEGKHGEARRRRPPVERQNKHLDLLMGRSCGASSQRSCHGCDPLAVGTPGLFNAPVLLSPIRIVVLFSGKVRMSVLDQQVGRHKPPFCSIPLTLVDFCYKADPFVSHQVPLCQRWRVCAGGRHHGPLQRAAARPRRRLPSAGALAGSQHAPSRLDVWTPDAVANIVAPAPPVPGVLPAGACVHQVPQCARVLIISPVIQMHV